MLRADTFLTLYVVHPLTDLRGRNRIRIPILMYHRISDSKPETAHPYYQTVTNPEVFASHIKFLHDNNYLTISLDDAVSYMESSKHMSARQLVITFDDGYQDFYTHAAPILSEYGFTATVFLPTAYIGEEPRRFNGAECLTWSQVRELRDAGVHFGSHTVTHPQLSHLKLENIRHEVLFSKQTIEDKLGSTVRSFAYPYAFPEADLNFRRRLQSLLEDAGYKNGVSTIIGRAGGIGDRFFMKRLPVNSWDDSRFFKAKLEGAYDWLHMFQYAYKMTQSNVKLGSFR